MCDGMQQLREAVWLQQQHVKLHAAAAAAAAASAAASAAAAAAAVVA